MDTQSIREAFTQFFVERGHTALPSSSLVPEHDPTLLFINAGMAPLKPFFLGEGERNFTRATSIQRCVRAGGKHNDLDNVGFTARHHTFFEMLGNFSFGDYFKKEAIRFAWDFLTQVLKLPTERLWITVFEEDDEAERIWHHEIGVALDRIKRIGAKDNFWAMGDTGPCGPCTEIFYDHGPGIAGGPPGSPDADGDRYIEIWNIVFMQYNRDKNGQLHPLPAPCVDTGMGLERIAAVMQNVHDNYDIDIFKTLIAKAAELVGTKDLEHRSLRVMADHIRATAFLMSDGVVPSNEGRGYVLRRIMRRALRHGHKLGMDRPFFYRLVDTLAEVMGKAYPKLIAQQKRIAELVLHEEQQFARTLSQGVKEFEAAISQLKGNQIPGEVVFKLYDTYGFPVDLTADMARERNLELDMPGFEVCMEAQRTRARQASHFAVDLSQKMDVDVKSEFVGYEHLFETTLVSRLYKDHQSVNQLEAGDRGVVVLPVSPFYAESGGQVGDQGELVFSGGRFKVTDTQKEQDAILHIGELVQGTLKVGMLVQAHVDASVRHATALNHSATHLLHAALREILGTHVTQKGSLVNPERLRFDFSHPKPMTDAEIAQVEALVNREIRANHPTGITLTTPDKAKAMGAMALFGEKYGSTVRVLKFGQFSTELCGGTHVNRTGDIALFKIVSETGIASGVRRLEAITGEAAFHYMQGLEENIKACAAVLKSPPAQLKERLEALIEKEAQLQKQLSALELKQALSLVKTLEAQAKQVAGVACVIATVTTDPKFLRDLALQLKSALHSGVVLLATHSGDRVNLLAAVSDDLTRRFNAGQLINHIAQSLGGKGGGRAELAQAGATASAEKLHQALENVPHWLESQAH